MMNIVVDGLIFEMQKQGGISRIYHEILPRMCQLDDSLRISLLTGGPLLQAIPDHPQIQHQPLGYWEKWLRPGRYFRQARRRGRIRAVTQWVRQNPCDVWHSTYYTMPDDYRKPTVATVYDLIYDQFSQIFSRSQDSEIRAQMRQAVMAAGQVICISRATRAELMRLFEIDPERLRLIHPGVGSAFRQTRGQESAPMNKRPFLLFVGGRGKHKNFITLLNANGRWPARHDFDLLVVGNPWTDQEIQQMRDLGALENVRLIKAATDQELALLYKQAAAFVYPSLYEGFGLPLLEAMACGCPVVASRIPSSLEIAADVPYYFEPDSVDELLSALDAAVSGGRSASRIERGVRLAAAYSWDSTARQTLEVYRGLA